MLVMIIALCSLTYATSSSLLDALKAVINYCLGAPFFVVKMLQPIRF